jgi:hypothetical protein
MRHYRVQFGIARAKFLKYDQSQLVVVSPMNMLHLTQSEQKPRRFNMERTFQIKSMMKKVMNGK